MSFFLFFFNAISFTCYYLLRGVDMGKGLNRRFTTQVDSPRRGSSGWKRMREHLANKGKIVVNDDATEIYLGDRLTGSPDGSQFSAHAQMLREVVDRTVPAGTAQADERFENMPETIADEPEFHAVESVDLRAQKTLTPVAANTRMSERSFVGRFKESGSFGKGVTRSFCTSPSMTPANELYADVTLTTRIVNYLTYPVYSRDARGMTYTHNPATCVYTAANGGKFERGILIQIITIFDSINSAMMYVENLESRAGRISDTDIGLPYGTAYEGYKIVTDYWVSESDFMAYKDGIYHFFSDMAIGPAETIRHPKDVENYTIPANMVREMSVIDYSVALVTSVRYVSDKQDATPMYMRFADNIVVVEPSAGVACQALNGKGQSVESTEYVEFIVPVSSIADSDNVSTSGGEIAYRRYTVDNPALKAFGIYKTRKEATIEVDALEDMRRTSEAVRKKLADSEASIKELNSRYSEEVRALKAQNEEAARTHEAKLAELRALKKIEDASIAAEL
ncbi:MAG: hypothetical protein ACKO0Z_25950, partial [Betaproteobacteria bacterium]